MSGGDCLEIPINLGNGSWTVNTFGECVDFYELAGCGGTSYRVDLSKNNMDSSITAVVKFMGIKSLRACPGYSKLLIILVIGVLFAILGFACSRIRSQKAIVQKLSHIFKVIEKCERV